MEQKFNKELIARLKKKYEETQEAVKRVGLPVLKLANKESATLRVMLFEHEGKSHLYHQTSLHFMGNVPLVCGKSHSNECILCDLGDWYKENGNKKFANKIRGGERYFINAMDVQTGELVILSLTLTTFNEFVSYFADDEYRPFLLGKKARNIKITRSGEGLETTYSIKVGMKDIVLEHFPETIDMVDQYPPESNEELLKRASELVDIPLEFLEEIEGGGYASEVDEEFPPEPDSEGNPHGKIDDEDEEFPPDENEKEEIDEEFPEEEVDESPKTADKKKTTGRKKTTTNEKKAEADTSEMNPKLASVIAGLRKNKK